VARVRRNDPAAAQQSVLPEITARDIHAYRQSGQLGRVDVYPIPEFQLPDAPSSIVRAHPTAVASPERTRASMRAASAETGFRFVFDGIPSKTVRGAGVIGRDPDRNGDLQLISIDDPGRSVSRNHLGYEPDARNRLLVFDLESANGSEIIRANEERIECIPGKRYPVDVGDTILLGNVSVSLERG
jgi:hypothetical protein